MSDVREVLAVFVMLAVGIVVTYGMFASSMILYAGGGKAVTRVAAALFMLLVLSVLLHACAGGFRA